MQYDILFCVLDAANWLGSITSRAGENESELKPPGTQPRPERARGDA